MPKRDPNITERDEQALRVACSYCGAGNGMQCWTTRSHRNQPAGLLLRYPHQQRIRASRRQNGTTKD